jgi:hypothetical protein
LIVDYTIGIRISLSAEKFGLDRSVHGEGLYVERPKTMTPTERVAELLKAYAEAKEKQEQEEEFKRTGGAGGGPGEGTGVGRGLGFGLSGRGGDASADGVTNRAIELQEGEEKRNNNTSRGRSTGATSIQKILQLDRDLGYVSDDSDITSSAIGDQVPGQRNVPL